VSSIVISLIAGWILILAITSVIPTNPATYAAVAANTAAPVAIWTAALSRVGAELLLFIAVVAQAFCGMASVTANSRMLYAFSRDGAVPGHRLWHRINPRTRTPTNSIWFCVVFAFILAVPSLWSSVAYAAVTSIATIGLYIAYVLPTLLRRLQGDAWVGGRWSLGKWSPVVGWVGIIWVGLISILFMLPEVGFGTIDHDNFNYAPIAVGVVLLFSGGYWLLSARKWFHGPKVQGSEDELKLIESGLSRAESSAPSVRPS
jgi:amino acid transporter